MKLGPFIIDGRRVMEQRRRLELLGRSRVMLLRLFFVLTLIAVPTYAQRIAILTPENKGGDIDYAARLADSLSGSIKILDHSMSESAFRSVAIGSVFNMTVAEARAAATVMGCDRFLLVRTGAHRRTSLSRSDYYESFAFLYLVDGRTGSLVSWIRKSSDADTQVKADAALADSVDVAAKELSSLFNNLNAAKFKTTAATSVEEVPSEGSPAAINLKPPIPYKRIKPEYTSTAFLYDVRATIDIEADISADGSVLATRITRWAGFGLEESVDAAVRVMNWRPALRNGRPLPMRVLLRYNSTKVDRDR
ncbi:MAG: hypothetical protein H0U23_00260 [Blastocatellia bacterium]|nr:hypothetical protein [Blastocatellia bacterium]